MEELAMASYSFEYEDYKDVLQCLRDQIEIADSDADKEKLQAKLDYLENPEKGYNICLLTLDGSGIYIDSELRKAGFELTFETSEYKYNTTRNGACYRINALILCADSFHKDVDKYPVYIDQSSKKRFVIECRAGSPSRFQSLEIRKPNIGL